MEIFISYISAIINKLQRNMASNNTSDLFVYTGKGQTVPSDVISVKFHSSVIEVDSIAFCRCTNFEGYSI